MLFIHKNSNFIIRICFSNFQLKIRSCLANFRIENSRIQRTSLCGTTLDLHYNTRILVDDQVFEKLVVGTIQALKFINPKCKVYRCVHGVSSAESCVLTAGIKYGKSKGDKIEN